MSLSELVISRILAKGFQACSPEFRNEILPDTTPVPFFGDFNSSSVLTIGLNPSSKEFPMKESDRRLTHLSDLGLPSEFYSLLTAEMNIDQARAIAQGMTSYFRKNPYTQWFSYAQIAILQGLNASYFDGEGSQRACHTDIFPWATKKFSSLTKHVQIEFKSENSNFLNSVLLSSQFETLVIFGNQTREQLTDDPQISFITDRVESDNTSAIFESGFLEVDGFRRPCFYTSQGPSVQFKSHDYKMIVHKRFGEFIHASLKIERGE